MFQMTNFSAHIFTIAKTNDPIFMQLVDQVRCFVVTGRLEPGDKMPSTREVSQALGINPMTVSKAYQRLRDEGVLESSRGSSMTVAPRRPAGESSIERSQLIRPELVAAVAKARQLGMDDESILALVADIVQT